MVDTIAIPALDFSICKLPSIILPTIIQYEHSNRLSLLNHFYETAPLLRLPPVRSTVY